MILAVKCVFNIILLFASESCAINKSKIYLDSGTRYEISQYKSLDYNAVITYEIHDFEKEGRNISGGGLLTFY